MNTCCTDFIKRVTAYFGAKFTKKQDYTKDAVNVVESFSKAKALYKEMCKRCHPDRFVEEDKKIIAENLFKKIQNNRYDYDALQHLYNEINTTLLDK